MLSVLSRKLTTFKKLLSEPQSARTYLCNRFPPLEPTSRLLWRLYPEWWRYRFHCWTNQLFTRKTFGSSKCRRYLLRIPNQAGIGDQIVTSWSETYLLAAKYDLTFVHHPFLRSVHSPDVDWEGFLGFSDKEIMASEVMADSTLKRIYLPPIPLSSPKNVSMFEGILEHNKQDNVLFIMGPGYFNANLDQSAAMPAVYRQKYWKNRREVALPPNSHTARISVAVHVRRGDVSSLKQTHPHQWKHRWIDTSYYKNLLSNLLQVLSSDRVKLHIYSDGTVAELEELCSLENVVFHLNDDPRQTFHEMITADLLVVSTSAFSICAGKISEGVKLVAKDFDSKEFRLFIPDSEDWVRVEPDGSLTREAVERLRKRFLAGDVPLKRSNDFNSTTNQQTVNYESSIGNAETPLFLLKST